MSKLSTILGVAALAGIGYYVGKKVFEKKKTEEADRAEKIALGELDESEVFVEEKHSSPKEKLQKASLFAVGAIKTGTEKFKEGIDEIINSDMVTKGETTMGEVKEFAADKKEKAGAFVADKKEKAVNLANDAKNNIKNEIDNLKNMVTSINTAPGEADEEEIIDAEAVEEDADEGIAAEDIEVEVEAEDAPEAEEAPSLIEEIAEEVSDIAEEAIEEVKDEIAQAVAEADETIEAIEEFPADDAIVDDVPTGDDSVITDEASMAMAEESDAIVDELADAAAEMAADISAFAEEIAEETSDASEDLDDISFEDMETVDTFDFSAADKL